MGVQPTRLLVLGVIRLRQPTHGYDIQRELQAWNADQWAGIARPSVYNQLRSLSREGFVEVDSVERSTSRPSKTLYTITPAGDQEFGRLLNEFLDNERPQPLDLLPALCFLPALTREEALDAVNIRMRRISEYLALFDGEMEKWFPREASWNYIQELFFLNREAYLAELRWAEGFIERVTRGIYPAATHSILPSAGILPSAVGAEHEAPKPHPSYPRSNSSESEPACEAPSAEPSQSPPSHG